MDNRDFSNIGEQIRRTEYRRADSAYRGRRYEFNELPTTESENQSDG